MQHRNTRPIIVNYNRAQRLINARANPDPDAAAQAESAIAAELLDPIVVERDRDVRPRSHSEHAALTPFGATEAFARALRMAMTQFATHTAGRAPKPGKYDLMFVTPVMFKDIWTVRQVVDELGVSYDFYAQQAIAYWIARGNTRVPRPTQLCAPDVVAHVLQQWVHRQSAAITPPDIAHAA